MTVKEVIKTGLVAELDGEYWGRQDNNFRGFGRIEKAMISSPLYLSKPEDMTDIRDERRELLKTAKLKKLTITTTYTIEDIKTKQK